MKLEFAKISLFFRALMLATLVSTALATKKFKNLVVFGDELSDTGNTYKLTNHEYPPSPPYYKGRFSNGKIWVDYFAPKLGAHVYNYAFGSATSDNTLVKGVVGPNNVTTPGVAQQVDLFLKTDFKKLNSEKTLFVVASLCADYVFSYGQADPVAVVKAVGNSIEKIYVDGYAKYIFVVSVPPVGNVPALKVLPPSVFQLIKDKIALHNQLLSQYLDKFHSDHPEVTLYFVNDMEQLISNLFDAAALKKMGITVIDKPCIPDNGFAGKNSVVCKKPKEYAFYDTFQALNTKIHAAVAKALLGYLK